MKKILLTGLFLAVIANCCGLEGVCASKNKTDSTKTSVEEKIQKDSKGSQEITNAIKAYKAEDYLACISILKEYTEKIDDNAVAWYYLGNSYMNIAMTKEASEAFDKVIALNSISSSPKLTSYAIQAQLCMKNTDRCKYENFTAAEVKKLKDNPMQFISDYYDSINRKAIKSDDVIQIENLIKGSYTNNIHPQAQEFILNERTKIQASQINSGKN